MLTFKSPIPQSSIDRVWHHMDGNTRRIWEKTSSEGENTFQDQNWVGNGLLLDALAAHDTDVKVLKVLITSGLFQIVINCLVNANLPKSLLLLALRLYGNKIKQGTGTGFEYAESITMHPNADAFVLDRLYQLVRLSGPSRSATISYILCNKHISQSTVKQILADFPESKEKSYISLLANLRIKNTPLSNIIHSLGLKMHRHPYDQSRIDCMTLRSYRARKGF